MLHLNGMRRIASVWTQFCQRLTFVSRWLLRLASMASVAVNDAADNGGTMGMHGLARSRRRIQTCLTVAIAVLMSLLPIDTAIAAPALATTDANPVPSTMTSTVLDAAAIQPHSFIAAAVDRVGAAVVRIDTERTVTQSVPDVLDDPFFRDFFGRSPSFSMPRERRLRGQGSGFIIDGSGDILTNAHVVDNADRVVVTLKDGREFEGAVEGVDPVTDLAVVRIQATGADIPVAPLGDSEQIQVGDWAIAVGNPLGLDNTVTLGIVSTLKRSSAAVGIPNKRLEFIQTDAAINPGNSGGPLLNAQGDVIGINTAIRADANGIGFAIPINKAKEIRDRLMRGETVQHPYLGVQISTLSPEIAKRSNDDPNAGIILPEVDGVLIVRVLPDTPAAASGLRRGDVILTVDGQAVDSAETLQGLVEGHRVGDRLRLRVQRGAQILTLFVQTAELQELG